jgi:hypothetical protein
VRDGVDNCDNYDVLNKKQFTEIEEMGQIYILSILLINLQHLLRRVLENQHKFIQLLQQQQTRLCSSGRLQEAIKPQDEQDYPQLKTLEPSISYYPVDQPFKHAPEVGDQFSVSLVNCAIHLSFDF